jgi:hypothetical protein
MNVVTNILIAAAIIGGIYAAATVLIHFKVKAKVKAHPLTYNVDIPDACYSEEARHVTPGGIVVRSYVAVPESDLQLIENGNTHTFRNARHYNPSWPDVDLSTVQVFLVPPMTHNVETDPGSPALLVKFLDAAGNIVPIQSAGTCIGVSGGLLGTVDPRYPSTVIPYEPGETDLHAFYFEESNRNEREHVEEWLFNRAMFFTYAIVGDVHPHFPDWIVGLLGKVIAKEFPMKPCTFPQKNLKVYFDLTPEQRAGVRDIGPSK